MDIVYVSESGLHSPRSTRLVERLTQLIDYQQSELKFTLLFW